MSSKRYLPFLIISICSCQQRDNSLTERERMIIIGEVQQTLQDYYADIRSKGLTAEFNYLDSSSDFSWVPPGSENSLSYDSIYKVLNKNAFYYRSVDNNWDTLKITPVDKKLALYTGRLKSVMTDTSGRVSMFTLIETGVLIKRKNGWKLLSGQTSLVN